MLWVLIWYSAVPSIQGCPCGRGGLCLERWDHPNNSCNCDIVSHGIFESTLQPCDKLVSYCISDICPHECVNGFGTHICTCVSENCTTFGIEMPHSYLWYPVREKTLWEPVILMFATTDISFSFEGGRKWTVNYQLCDSRNTGEVMAMCSENGGGEDCLILSYMMSALPIVVSCKVPLPYSQERLVYVDSTPVGEYHDVVVSINKRAVQYRVFLETGELNRKCPYQVTLTGCGKTPSSAMKIRAEEQTLFSAEVLIHDPRKLCPLKGKEYRWRLSSFHRKIGDSVLINKGRSVAVTPAKYGFHDGLVTVEVDITFLGVPTVEDETVFAVCYIHLTPPSLSVHFPESQLNYICGVKNTVTVSPIINVGVESDLRFKWVCPPKLEACRQANVYERVLTFSTHERCNAAYEVMLSVAYGPLENVWNGTLRFVRMLGLEQTQLTVTCDPECGMVVPSRPVTLTLNGALNFTEQFTWRLDKYELKNYTFTNECTMRGSQVVTIPGYILQANEKYLIDVQSDYLPESRKIQFFIKTVGPKFTCDISPESGQRLVDLFKITCIVTFKSSEVLFYVKEGPEQDLVLISSSLSINVTLNQVPIVVEAKDQTFTGDTVTFKVTLKEATGDKYVEMLKSVPSRLERANSLISEGSFDEAIDEIAFIARIGDRDLKFEWKQTMIKQLALVRHCFSELCIWKTLYSVRRLITNSENPLNGIGELVLYGSTTVYTIIPSLYNVIPKSESYPIYIMKPYLDYFLSVLLYILGFFDSSLVDLSVDDDVRMIHYRKVIRGITFARKALAELGLFITQHLPQSDHEFVISSQSGESMTVISNYPEHINCMFAKSGKTHLQLTNDTIESLRLNGTLTAVAILYLKTAWWFDLKNHSFGEPVEAFFYGRPAYGKNWTHINRFGMVKIIVPVKLAYAEITNKVPRYVEPDSLIPIIHAYRIAVQQGYGSIIAFFPSALIGHLHISFDFSFPDVDFFRYNMTTFDYDNYQVLKYYSHKPRSHLFLGISHGVETPEFTFHITLVQCLTMSERGWTSESCLLDGFTSNELVVCTCDQMSMKTAVSLVPEYYSVVDISMHTPEHFALLSLLVMIGVVFLFFMVTACLIEKFARDKAKKTIWILRDNWPGDDYVYLIAILTGGRCLSGTSSHAALRIIGDEGESRVHILSSEKKVSFKQAHDSWFILFTPRTLGTVQRIEMWHDNKGSDPDWYCAQVVIWDIEAHQRFFFPVQSWITYAQMHWEYKTSYIFERIEEGGTWPSFIGGHMCCKLFQEHHWISLFALHPRSIYTRLDRFILISVVVFVATTSTIVFYMDRSGIMDRSKISLTSHDFTVIMEATFTTSVVAALHLRLFEFRRIKSLRGFIITPKKSLIYRLFIRQAFYLPAMMSYVGVRKNRRPMIIVYAVTLATNTTCAAIMLYLSPNIHLKQGIVTVIASICVLFCEALVFNPIIILIEAILVSYVTKEPPLDIYTIDIPPTKFSLKRGLQKALARSLKERCQPEYKPPLKSKIRKRALAEAKKELFHYFDIPTAVALFVLVYFLVYFLGGLHDPAQISNITPEILASIHTPLQYYTFLRETALPGVHNEFWYNGKPMRDQNTTKLETLSTGYDADYATKVIGVPELRQQRVKPEPQNVVPIPFKKWYTHCDRSFTMWNEDNKPYMELWKAPGPGDVPKFHHWSVLESKTGAVIGASRYMYDGSGYIERLQWTSRRSRSKVTDLQIDHWIDNRTRVIFFTVNQYNVNNKQISSVTIVTETLASGVYRSRFTSTSMPLLKEEVIIGFTLAILLVITLLLIRILTAMSQLGKEFTFDSLRCIGFAVIIFGYTLVSSLIGRYFQIFLILEEFEYAPRDHYFPLNSWFSQNDAAFELLGLFILSVAAFACAIVANSIRYEGFSFLTFHTKHKIASYGFTVVFAIYFSLCTYDSSSGEIRHTTYPLFLKEFTHTDSAIAVNYINLKIIGFSFPLFVVLTRLVVPIFVDYYTEAVDPYTLRVKAIHRAFGHSPKRINPDRKISYSDKEEPAIVPSTPISSKVSVMS